MTAPVTDVWPWLAVAGLGAFHGLNPGMGWLFAVALGLHRHDRRIVWLSPIPIALGHALSIGVVAGAFLWAGFVINASAVRVGSGLILIGWAAYHWRYGHRHRVRFGMQAGMAALVVWSFLMATAHGAGLMLWPALMPLCFPTTPVDHGPLPAALVGIGLHTFTMLAVTTLVAIAVYEWLGLEILRRA
ncbi:MAG TPA: hypothetical protein VG673_00730, partial [Actinomycetota bacterium]|nr:hypothetical protein [Actinomycetota bacterium]